MNLKKPPDGVGIVVLGILLFAVVSTGTGHHTGSNIHHDMTASEHREAMILHKDAAIADLMPKGDYACCLEKPCITCVQLTPHHGEDAACTCLEDVMTGKHPCGECMGGILAGRGNPYITKYFAAALAEELGEEYTDELKQIVFEKYGTPVDEQI